MSILEELLKSVEKSELDEQVKKICDQIMAEERPKFENPKNEPKGSNIFLAIEIKDKTDSNIIFICLEREEKEKYIVSKWSRKKSINLSSLKRVGVWEVDSTDRKAEKILKFYAIKLKYLKGE